MHNLIKVNNHKLEYSFIFTLLMLISLFYTFQINNVPKSNKLPKNIPFIIVSYPLNINVKNFNKYPQKPVIPIEDDEIEILEEIFYEDIEIDSTGKKINQIYIPFNKLNFVINDGKQYNLDIIVISFKIGADGKIKNHILLKCAENDSTTVTDIVAKAYSRIWDCKYEKGTAVEYYRNESYVLLK